MHFWLLSRGHAHCQSTLDIAAWHAYRELKAACDAVGDLRGGVVHLQNALGEPGLLDDTLPALERPVYHVLGIGPLFRLVRFDSTSTTAWSPRKSKRRTASETGSRRSLGMRFRGRRYETRTALSHWDWDRPCDASSRSEGTSLHRNPTMELYQGDELQQIG